MLGICERNLPSRRAYAHVVRSNARAPILVYSSMLTHLQCKLRRVRDVQCHFRVHKLIVRHQIMYMTYIVETGMYADHDICAPASLHLKRHV